METIKILHISVKNKIATYRHRDGAIVCGNKGYKIVFTFDEEWDDYSTKTARFIWGGKYYDQIFTGVECQVPILNDTTEVTIGVYAGDLKTTTPAEIPCLISILCGNPEMANGMVKDYREEAVTAAQEAKNAAEEARAAAQVVVHPVMGVTPILNGHRVTITDIEGTKHFDVKNGEGVLSEDEEALLDKLSKWYDESHYTKLTISSFTMSPTTTTYEIGSSTNVVFSWSFNKTPVEVTFAGSTQNATQTGSASIKVTASSHTSQTYTLYGKYKEGETATKSLSVNFRNKYYYGCATEPSLVNSVFIKALSSGGWANAKTVSFTPNCTSGKYVWYAYPKRLGQVVMWMGGFQGGFEDPQTVSVTNDSGYTEEYYVYRSTNAGIGNLSIEAK